MAGIGDSSGRAVILNFPEHQGYYNSPGPSKGAQSPGQFPEISNDEYGIQLDAAGMDEVFFDSLGAMQDFAYAAAEKGVNVMGPTDLRNPQARNIQKMWRRAYDTHMRNAERLRQAKDNQDLYQKAFLEGKVQGKSGMFDQNAGPFTMERMMKETYPTVHPYVTNANAIMSRKPRNQEEYQDLLNMREQVMADIDNMVATGEMNPDAAHYYKGQVAPVIRPEERLLKAQVSNQYAAASAHRARAEGYKKAAEDKGGSGSSGNLVMKYPELLRLAEIMTAEDPQALDKARDELGSLVNERALRDGKGVYYKSVRRGEDGEGLMSFAPRGEKIENADYYDENGKEVPWRDPLSFTSDDITPAMKNFLKGAKYESFLEDMQEAGLMDSHGRISASRVIAHMNGQAQASTPGITPTKSNTSFENFKKGARAHPNAKNLSDKQLQALYNDLPDE